MRHRFAGLVTLVLLPVAGGCGASAPASTRPAPAVTAANVVSSAALDPMATGTALEAGLRYVASTDSLMAHSPIGRREIFRKLVTADQFDVQDAAFETAASTMAAKLGVPVERLVWVEAPLTATVTASTAGSASVDVWTVSIIGVPDKGAPQQVWRTVHLGLSLVGRAWLVAAATADAGPTPAGNELALQSTWAEFDLVATWPPVVTGVAS